MINQKQARAPYNFVPFAVEPVRRYEMPASLPPHDAWDPELLSGEIKVTVTAETPIFLSSGAKKDRPDETDFFRTLNGRYAIPGSGFRGLIRENMQILGLGLLRSEEDFCDYRLLYRQLAAAKSSLGGGLKRHYQTVLGINNAGVPLQVGAGYLYKAENGYHIQPIDGQVIPIARKDAAAPWRNRWAFSQHIYLKRQGASITLSETPPEGEDAIEGSIVGTGWMGNQRHLYFFPAKCSGQPIHLTREDVISFEEDYEAKRNTLSGTGKIKTNPAYWALPRNGERKPVFFVRSNGVTSFGMSKFLRIAYEHSIGEGLPQAHQALQKASAPFLDYPYAIMGFAGKQASFRSRVSVGDLEVNGVAEPQPLFYTLLGEPKLSFYPGYAQEGKHYNNKTFRLRGFKQYWLKDAAAPETQPSKVATAMRPLPAGASFTGTIRYRNLHEDELGLLLWSIALEPDCRQSLGMGKPYGFGRVNVTIDSIWEQDPAALYGKGLLTAGSHPVSAPTERIAQLISAYEEKVSTLTALPQGIRNLPAIQDFFYLKRTIRTDLENISYLSLKEHQNITQPLPTVEEIRTGCTAAQQTRKLQVGDIVTGCVTDIKDFGFFVDLPTGERGLVHIKEIADRWLYPEDIESYVLPGDMVPVKIISISGGKIGLSYKQARKK